MRTPILLAVCAVILATVAARSSLAQPPETGQRQLSPLPAENTLPGQPVSNRPLPPETELVPPDPLAKGPAQTQTLPSEETLPGDDPTFSNKDKRGQDAGKGKPGVEQDQPATQRPILRLDYPGHTARIRSLDLSTDGNYLVSGGDDKDVHVWRRDEAKQKWNHYRTLRWQVWRGPRGRIYDLAIDGDRVAIAGHGAMGGLGEIALYHYQSGDLQDVLVDNVKGHRQPVLCLNWSSHSQDQPSSRIASQDMDGLLLLWSQDANTGLWQNTVVVPNDRDTYGDKVGTQLQRHRGFVAHAFRTPKELLVPVWSRFDKDKNGITTPVWKIVRIDLLSKKTQPIKGVEFRGSVRQISVSRDGKTAVVVDQSHQFQILKFDDLGNHRKQPANGSNAPYVCGEVSTDGKRLCVGSHFAGKKNGALVSRLQWWNIEPEVPEYMGEINPQLPVGDICLAKTSENKKPLQAKETREIFWAPSLGDESVHRCSLETQPNGHRVVDRGIAMASATNRPAQWVRFARGVKSYQLLIQNHGDSDTPTQWRFDLETMRLVQQAAPPSKPAAKPVWDVRQVRENQQGVARLFQGDQPRGRTGLLPHLHGVRTCSTTFSASGEDDDQANKAVAVVVGTDGRNNLYVYEGNADEPAHLLRQFRGHGGAVRSVDVTEDGKFLVSASDDATLSIWNLEGIFKTSRLNNRWGIDLEMEQGLVRVMAVDEAGPLYFRGVRIGDTLRGIQWADDQGVAHAEADGKKLMERLKTLAFDRQVVFQFNRLGRPLPPFQSFAAWHPLATLFIDGDREWAYWTPSGIYDASFNGHQRFGWQVNRGVSNRPDFFRAAQFRRRLERPDVMRRLLRSGSLPAAMREQVGSHALPPGKRAIIAQYKTKPIIQILSPKTGVSLADRTVTALVQVKVPGGGEIDQINAFISGVPPIETREIKRPEQKMPEVKLPDPNSNVRQYEFVFEVPSGTKLQLDVIAASNSGSIGKAQVLLDGSKLPKPVRKPKMHLLAIGAGNYDDPRISNLKFAANSARKFSDFMRTRSASHYQVSTESLTDQQATSPLWRICADSLIERAASDVAPDDVVLIYFCGHGLRDRRNANWYFVPADANFARLMNDQYDECLSLEDLREIVKLPCRKIAVVDSCHSGAVQTSLRNDDLKSLMRFLETGLVLTVTASEGNEEAAEVDEAGLGRFTSQWIQAIQGGADQDADGVIQLKEVVRFVQKEVAADAEQEGLFQNPTASPSELIEAIELPLARLR